MSKSIKWVSLPVVLAIHDELMVQFGGSPGIRDQGLLLSALSRPEQSAHYEKPDIANLAATYAVAITNNLSFADGNKRTGFVTGVLFLELNGFNFEASEEDATEAVFGLAERSLDEAAYAVWLGQNSKRKRKR